MGVYERTTNTFNSRAVFQQYPLPGASARVLYSSFSAEYNRDFWYVGDITGEQVGVYAYVDDAAISPQDISAKWKVLYILLNM